MNSEVSQRAAQVVIAGVPKPLAYQFSPRELEVEIGSEVTVEIGRRQAKGWVIRTLTVPEALSDLKIEKTVLRAGAAPARKQLGFFAEAPAAATLKDIRASAPSFLPGQLRLFQWMSEYYGCDLVDVIETAVPKRQTGRRPLLCELTDTGRDRFATDDEWREGLQKRSKVQYRILERLTHYETGCPLSELTEISKTARATLKKLEEKGLIEIFDETSLAHLFPISERDPADPYAIAPDLTPEQQAAVKRIGEMLDSKLFSPVLLQGVTGSGKTEVYLRAIQKVLDEGGSALVVVPEIALTPQLFDRFESRLSVPPVLLHSQVGPGARWRAWENMLSGKAQVVIGARSAVFAPLQNLRLVIVDEEHESSYKQSEGLRYHARDVAMMRAKFSDATIVLGSATPSFETLINAKRGRYELLQLTERVSSRPMPIIEIVDLSKIKRRDMPSENLSPQLFEGIRETLDRGGQVIILYNRRGFSTFLQCQTCGEVLTCPHCSVTMTYHRARNRVLCHYCNASSPPPKYCPRCRDPHSTRVEEIVTEKEGTEESEAMGLLVARGAGTEKVVEEIAEHFPAARIVRLDRDTTTRKDSYRRILGSMRNGEADILVGTQMIAKGHDLPGVTLVGIIDADVGLHAPDFRSSERIYQLITQAAGRAGRGTEPGHVIVQTREPNHPTIVATVTGRFSAFARYELDFRKKLRYPPWGRLMRVIVSSPDQQDAFQGAAAAKAALTEFIRAVGSESAADDEDSEGETSPVTDQATILGPAPASLERLRGRYRWHMLIKSPSSRIISHIAGRLAAWRDSQKQFADLRVAIDVDPYDML